MRECLPTLDLCAGDAAGLLTNLGGRGVTFVELTGPYDEIRHASPFKCSQEKMPELWPSLQVMLIA